MFKEALNKVVERKNLSMEEAREVMETIMTGKATNAQMGAFLTALRMKGETVEEVSGFAQVMREKATPVRTAKSLVVDTCGTGGDGAHTFNISTAAAFVIAGGGVPVAKHGNRSVSSKSGSADVLESLGVNLNLTAEQVGESIDKIGIGFLFAPSLHGAMKHAIGPRREMGIRTVFNVLGPLTNPAGAQGQVLGVFSPDLTEVIAGVLAKLGTRHAYVVHGYGGLDEVSLSGPTIVAEVHKGKITKFELDPVELGFELQPHEAIVGGSPEENAKIVRSVLAGKKGPHRDIVVLNAALGMIVGRKANSIADGVKLANQSIDCGNAMGKLVELIRFSNNYQSLVG